MRKSIKLYSKTLFKISASYCMFPSKHLRKTAFLRTMFFETIMSFKNGENPNQIILVVFIILPASLILRL